MPKVSTNDVGCICIEMAAGHSIPLSFIEHFDSSTIVTGGWAGQSHVSTVIAACVTYSENKKVDRVLNY